MCDDLLGGAGPENSLERVTAPQNGHRDPRSFETEDGGIGSGVASSAPREAWGVDVDDRDLLTARSATDERLHERP